MFYPSISIQRPPGKRPARGKAQMPPDRLKRLDEPEQARHFGKNAPGERGRSPAESEMLA